MKRINEERLKMSRGKPEGGRQENEIKTFSFLQGRNIYIYIFK